MKKKNLQWCATRRSELMWQFSHKYRNSDHLLQVQQQHTEIIGCIIIKTHQHQKKNYYVKLIGIFLVKEFFQVSLTYYFLMEASRALVNITHLCVSFRVTQRCTNAVTVLAYMISTKSISSATIPPWKQKFHLVLIIHSKWALLQKWVLSLIWSTISSL